MSSPLVRLAELLREEGGLLASALVESADAFAPHGDLVAMGPRAAGRQAELALVVEMVREGYLLHYGAARLVDGADPGLALLAGDRLYALGLAKLADAGDLTSVTELADVIALSAVAHAGGDQALADAVWLAGVGAVGWGAVAEHESAKAAARDQDPRAEAQLRAVARQLVGDVAR